MGLQLSHLKLGPTRALVADDIPDLPEVMQRIIAILRSPYSPAYDVGLQIDEEGNVYGIENKKLIYMEKTGRVASGYLFGIANGKIFILHEVLLATGGKVRPNDVQKFMAMSFYTRTGDKLPDIPLPCDDMGVPLAVYDLKKNSIVNDNIIEQLKLKYAEKDLPGVAPVKRTSYELLQTCLQLIGDRDINTAVNFHLDLYRFIFSKTIEDIEYAKTQDTHEAGDVQEEDLFAGIKKQLSDHTSGGNDDDDFPAVGISESAGSGEVLSGESEEDESDFPAVAPESKADAEIRFVKKAAKVFGASEVTVIEPSGKTKTIPVESGKKDAPLVFRKKGIKKAVRE